jgi:hypothetical protein
MLRFSLHERIGCALVEVKPTYPKDTNLDYSVMEPECTRTLPCSEKSASGTTKRINSIVLFVSDPGSDYSFAWW